jgi:hypothetical protein
MAKFDPKVVWTAILIRQARDVPELLRGAAAGDALSRRFLLALDNWLAMQHEAPAKKAPLCLACEHAFLRRDVPYTFMLTYSDDPRVEQMFLTGVCAGCASKSDPELLNYGSEKLSILLDGEILGFVAPMQSNRSH